MSEFIKEDLEFYLPNSFKGLSKQYLLDCIFNKKIQSKWKPSLGDVMVGYTGNIFVISAVEELDKSIGGNMYYFGGGACTRNNSNILDSTFCYTANESGKYYHPINGEQKNYFHSSIREFRYIPYPHEL